MTEQPRVLHTFGLHDRAIHEVVLIHENTLLVDVSVSGDLTAVLPPAVLIDAVHWVVDSARASEVAAVAANAADIRVGNTRRRVSGGAVHTRERLAINAVIVARRELSNVCFAAISGQAVAVRRVGDAVEDAVTTSLNVSGIAVAVGGQVSNVDVVGLRVLEQVIAFDSRGEGRREWQEQARARVRARSVIEIEALVAAEIQTSLRALVVLRAARITVRLGVSDLAPAVRVFATVALARR